MQAGCRFSGIAVGPEYGFLEGSWVSSAVISSNIIMGAPGGIIVGFLVDLGAPSTVPDQAGIQFLQNRIINVPYAPIILSSAVNSVVQGNAVIASACALSAVIGYGSWYTGNAIFVSNTAASVVSGNIVQGQPYCTPYAPPVGVVASAGLQCC